MRRTVAIALWIVAVWHVELERIKAMAYGKDWCKRLRTRHMPEIY